MPVAIKGTGGGSVTLDAGAAAADTTLTLPNTNGTVINTAPSTAGNVLTSDGTVWTSAAPSGGGQFQNQLFTASGTWTTPTGVTKVKVWCMGAGGGSATANYGCVYGGNGGYGGFALGLYTVVPGTIYTVTVGTGGNSAYTGGSGSVSGTAGGSTSFGSFISATGGGGASAQGNVGYTDGTTGTGSSGNIRNSSHVGNGYNTAPFGLNFGGSLTAATTAPATAVAWTVAQYYPPGHHSTEPSYPANSFRPSLNGLVYLEWVG